MIRLPGEGERFGRYELVELLGRGGMGVVHAARDTDLGRDVALKLVAAHLAEDEEFRSRFQREATVMAALDSPHVVQIFEHGERDGVLFLATQLVPGGDLQKRLARHGPLAPAVALDVLGQVLEALRVAHRAGIVHRDIKPANVLVRDRESGLHALLGDFGIATAPDLQHSRTGSVTGSLQYMPPERHQGEDAGPAGDLYAAGCLLWALLTGAPPWAGTEVEIAMAHLSADVPSFAGEDEFSTSLNSILARSMAKDPRERYKSAAAMRHDVLRARESAPSVLAVTPETAVRRPAVAASSSGPLGSSATQPRKRSALLAALLSAGVAALVAVVIMLVVLRDPPTSIEGEPAGEPVSEDSQPPTLEPELPPYRCWDGSRTEDLDTCGEPNGAKGLRYVFPSVDNCSAVPARSSQTHVLECPYRGGMIKLVQFTSVAEAQDHFDWSFGHPPTGWLHDDVHYGYMWSEKVAGKAIRSTRLYRDGAYTATVDARSSAAHDRGVDLLYAQDVRAPGDFKGVRANRS